MYDCQLHTAARTGLIL